MISNNILEKLKENSQIKNFLDPSLKIDFKIKQLTNRDVKILLEEYPRLLNFPQNELLSNNLENLSSFFSITLVKIDGSNSNYIKLKKTKIYYNEKNQKVIKILHN